MFNFFIFQCSVISLYRYSGITKFRYSGITKNPEKQLSKNLPHLTIFAHDEDTLEVLVAADRAALHVEELDRGVEVLANLVHTFYAGHGAIETDALQAEGITLVGIGVTTTIFPESIPAIVTWIYKTFESCTIATAIDDRNNGIVFRARLSIGELRIDISQGTS